MHTWIRNGIVVTTVVGGTVVGLAAGGAPNNSDAVLTAAGGTTSVSTQTSERSTLPEQIGVVGPDGEVVGYVDRAAFEAAGRAGDTAPPGRSSRDSRGEPPTVLVVAGASGKVVGYVVGPNPFMSPADARAHVAALGFTLEELLAAP